jgi:hypothetical protein
MNVQGQRVAVLRDVRRVPPVTPWYDVGRVSCLYAQGPILCTGDGVLHPFRLIRWWSSS